MSRCKIFFTVIHLQFFVFSKTEVAVKEKWVIILLQKVVGFYFLSFPESFPLLRSYKTLKHKGNSAVLLNDLQPVIQTKKNYSTRNHS